jgi:hypothetical protein
MKYGWQSTHPLDFNCASNDFNLFVNKALDYKPDGWYSYMVDQFTCNVPGGIKHIARLEDGINGIIRALNSIGLEYDINIVKSIPRANDSDMGGYSSKHWARYSQQTYDRVTRVERKVIDHHYYNYIIDPNDHVGQRPW